MEVFLCGIFLPIFIFIILSGFGRWLGRVGASVVAVLGLGITTIVFFYYGYHKFVTGSVTLIHVGGWMLEGLDWNFLLDPISLQMCFLISSITFCVLLYSTEYMFHDPHVVRFLSLLVLFAFFMLILVTSGNLVQMFIGWEGVGFVSFLLINFWYMRLEANRSAIKAMLFNRIGDSFYLLGIIICLFYLQTTDILLVTQASGLGNISDLFTVTMFSCSFGLESVLFFLFFLAAVGKSAQLGLHAWLPDAMEGPTPVSSLLHSATMVTAGVFLLTRISPLLQETNALGVKFIVFVGAITACLNAIFGFFQNDLKKIIAFSTCSQLGIMVVGVIYQANVGFYHLVNHGFFKALLFLSAGSIIHALGNEQDVRKMGGLYDYLPFTRFCLSIGSVALIGVPFFSGFYSKEFILFSLYGSGLWFDRVIFLFLFVASLFTVLYSVKIIKSVFFCDIFKSTKTTLQLVHEPSRGMLFSMSILAFLSVFFGFFHEDVFNLLGSNGWFNVIGLQPTFQANFINLFFATELGGIGVKCFFTFFFIFLIQVFYAQTEQQIMRSKLYIRPFFFRGFFLVSSSKVWSILHWCGANKLGFISLYRKAANSFLYVGYRVTGLLIDRGFFELIGPTFFVRLFEEQKQKISNNVFFPVINMFLIFFCIFCVCFFVFFVKFTVLFLCMFLFLYLYFYA